MIKIIAHTGCMDTKMNSIASILAGIRESADYIEVDVRFLNGQPVLTHDSPSAKETYLPLAEALYLIEHTPSVNIALDLKEWDRIGELAALLKHCRMQERSIYLGNFMNDMEKMRKYGGAVPCFPNVYPSQVSGLSKNDLLHLAETVRNLGAMGVGMNYIAVTPEIVEAFHHHHLLVSAWTVDEEEAIRQMTHCKVDFITSNRLDNLRKYIQINR